MKDEKVKISIRVTEAEKEKVKRNAELCGISQSEYMRQCALGKEPMCKPPDEYWELLDKLYWLHDVCKNNGKDELCAKIQAIILAMQGEVS